MRYVVCALENCLDDGDDDDDDAAHNLDCAQVHKHTHTQICFPRCVWVPVKDMCVFVMAFSREVAHVLYFYKICSCKNSLIMKYFHRTKFQCTIQQSEMKWKLVKGEGRQKK